LNANLIDPKKATWNIKLRRKDTDVFQFREENLLVNVLKTVVFFLELFNLEML
jgi:hypothetical protein